MPKINRFTAPLWDLDTFNIFEDFWADQSDLFWIDVVTDTGTVLINDAARGIATLTPSDASVVDNDEVYFSTANELFLFLDNRPIYGECLLSFVETTSGVYNACFGFANAPAANLLIDNGGGMRATGSIVAIYKIDGETVWTATARNQSEVTITKSVNSAVMTSGVYQKLQIIGTDVGDGLSCRFTYMVDDQYLKDSNRQIISHSVLYASATEMAVTVGAKLGASTNNDALLVDYIYAAQRRTA